MGTSGTRRHFKHQTSNGIFAIASSNGNCQCDEAISKAFEGRMKLHPGIASPRLRFAMTTVPSRLFTACPEQAAGPESRHGGIEGRSASKVSLFTFHLISVRRWRLDVGRTIGSPISVNIHLKQQDRPFFESGSDV
jgi:hypothetical protein